MTKFKEVISKKQIIRSFIESIQYQAQFIKNNDNDFYIKYEGMKRQYVGPERDLRLSHLLHMYYFLNMDTTYILDVMYNDDCIVYNNDIESIINEIDDDDMKYISQIIQNFEDYSVKSLFQLVDEYMNVF